MIDIFVFGSNKAGIHGAGAAKYAFDNHGAQWGVGEGLTGNSYAIPTKGYDIEYIDINEIDEAIGRFVDFAKENKHYRFFLTPIGCGLAGHSKKRIWSILQKRNIPDNVFLTSTWVTD